MQHLGVSPSHSLAAEPIPPLLSPGWASEWQEREGKKKKKKKVLSNSPRNIHPKLCSGKPASASLRQPPRVPGRGEKGQRPSPAHLSRAPHGGCPPGGRFPRGLRVPARKPGCPSLLRFPLYLSRREAVKPLGGGRLEVGSCLPGTLFFFFFGNLVGDAGKR